MVLHGADNERISSGYGSDIVSEESVGCGPIKDVGKKDECVAHGEVQE